MDNARVGVVAALAVLTLGASVSNSAPPGETVRGSMTCGHHFRDTLFIIPSDKTFTLTGIGISFRNDRARLRDSMYVAVFFTDARLWKRNEVDFRRGPHAGEALGMFERFHGGMEYAPGDTLVVTLHNIYEEYWQLEGWPAHVVRWEGFWTPRKP